MRLLIIRHAVAVERGTPGFADDERPLTPEGERKFKKAARGLAGAVARPDAILTSPLPRALRTAEIAAAAFGKLTPRRTDVLVAGTLDELAAALGEFGAEQTVALVGHEPHLSDLLARLLGSSAAERLAFGKGGAALVDVPGRLEDGGSLVFFLGPKLLRALA